MVHDKPVNCICFQAEDGIRDLVRSRGLGDVYKRQARRSAMIARVAMALPMEPPVKGFPLGAMTVAPLSLIHI